MPCAGNGAGFDDFGLAAPLAGQQFVGRQLFVNPLRIGAGQVDLVQRHDNGDLGRPGMADGFLGLGHNAVVGRHDQHGDIGYIGAAARISVKASCPGVSTKAIARPSFSTR